MFPRPNLTCPCCGRPMAVTFGQKFLLCSTVFSPLRIFSQPDLYGEVFSCPGCTKNLEAPGWVHWLPKIISLAFPAALLHWLWARDNTSIFPAREWSAILAILLILYPLFVVLTAWFCPLRCTGEPGCQHRHDFSGSDPLPLPALRQKPRLICPACGKAPVFSFRIKILCILRSPFFGFTSSSERSRRHYLDRPYTCCGCHTLLCCPQITKRWQFHGALLIWFAARWAAWSIPAALLLILLWCVISLAALAWYSPLSVHPCNQGHFLSLKRF